MFGYVWRTIRILFIVLLVMAGVFLVGMRSVESPHTPVPLVEQTATTTQRGEESEPSVITPRVETNNDDKKNNRVVSPEAISPDPSHDEILASAVVPHASLPGPLEEIVETNSSYANDSLIVEEIIKLTNIERVREGLPKLSSSARLGAIAEAKAVDMITRHYFAHESPSGVDIGGLASTYGYAYLHIGENLALGDFASSSHVVNGWMNSPGHRANIMGADFTEIGVSALRGAWEGREVWFAVQEFGKPMPNCPAPSAPLRQKISLYESQLDALNGTLSNLKITLDTLRDTDHSAYNTNVDDYNTIIKLYNTLLDDEKKFIAEYNEQVRKYNICMDS